MCNFRRSARRYRHSTFVWKSRPAIGVYARGFFTRQGRIGIETGRIKGFSPEFHLDDNFPAEVICSVSARPSFGGLAETPFIEELLFSDTNNPFEIC